MFAAQGVQTGEEGRQRPTLRLGGGPVPRPQLVLLRVQVLLAARSYRLVLAELVPGVDPPGRAERGGEDRSDLEARTSRVLKVLVQDVRRVDKQIRTQEIGRASCRER